MVRSINVKGNLKNMTIIKTISVTTFLSKNKNLTTAHDQQLEWKHYFLVIQETCNNEPTQQGALPLRGERRGTLTARP